MLARDWYYNQRRQLGLDSAVASIYDRHDDLGSARNIEHDPVKLRPAAGDLYEFTYACRLHRSSVLPCNPSST